MVRGEITGRKPRVTIKRRGPPRSDPSAIEPTRHSEPSAREGSEPPAMRGPPPLAFSIAQFCEWHSLSESMFYKLKSQGLAPHTMQVGRRRLISAEEAARWRAEREQAAAAAA